MCAHACEAIAASGAIGRNVPTASPCSTPSSTERLGEASHLVRELGPRERAALALLRRPDGGLAVGRLAGPAVHARLCDVQPGADEPRRPLDPARVVEDVVPLGRERDPEVVDDRSPEAVGLVEREPVQLLVRLAAERAREPGDVRRCELLGGRGPREVTHWALASL